MRARQLQYFRAELGQRQNMLQLLDSLAGSISDVLKADAQVSGLPDRFRNLDIANLYSVGVLCEIDQEEFFLGVSAGRIRARRLVSPIALAAHIRRSPEMSSKSPSCCSRSLADSRRTMISTAWP